MTEAEILDELNIMIAIAKCSSDKQSMIELKQQIEGTVVVQPPPTWNGKCSNYPHTVYHEFDWSQPGNMLLDTRGSLGNGILVCSFTTPDVGALSSGSLMSFNITGFPGGEPTPSRKLAVNPVTPACDFRVPANWFKSIRAGTGTLYLGYENDGGSGLGIIRRNTRYYVMVANDSGRKGELRLEINKPQGL